MSFNVFRNRIVCPGAFSTTFVIQYLSDQPWRSIHRALRHELTGAFVLRIIAYTSETETGCVLFCKFPFVESMVEPSKKCPSLKQLPKTSIKIVNFFGNQCNSK